jgi:isoprenylcysteine carboxyl methyltransferase (ICMT) family protein YpbQ
MEHLLWKILETVGLLLFVVAMIATTLIHTIGYIRFMVGRLRAEDLNRSFTITQAEFLKGGTQNGDRKK